jgi:SAM-dependent methyltransferase
MNDQPSRTEFSEYRCKICNGECTEEILVKEMMFGTRRQYAYKICDVCKTVQLVTEVKDAKELYPFNYYSFVRGRKVHDALKNWLTRRKAGIELGIFPGSGFAALLSQKIGLPQLAARSLKGLIHKQSRILDVGCGAGELLIALHELGFNSLTGIDPFIHESVNAPVRIIKEDVFSHQPADLYDVIMLHHSFEHMSNPKEVLMRIGALMKDNGLCIIRVPVADGKAFEEYRENWFQLDAPRHTFLHTSEGMARLVQGTGLYISEEVDDSNETSVIASEQYKNDIPLVDGRGYFASFWRRNSPFHKPYFSRQQIEIFKEKADHWKKINKGDQKVFYLRKHAY